MRTRTQTIASFFTVAMAATLLGALVTTQVRRPERVEARPAPSSAPSVSEAGRQYGAGVTFDTFRDIARAKTAAVVNINTSKVIRLPRFRDPFHDFFGDELERFFGPEGRERMRQTSLGSGFLIDAEGYILTNRHVIEGADEVSVTLSNRKRYDAKIVGRDARTDVALLKIDAKDALTVLDLGDSDQVEVGEWVIAIGSPFGFGNSVTVGVVSFKGRDLELGVRRTSVDMIQTDAAINPGNSGGPLLNTRGQVVGINTMIVTDGMSRANAGVGFSVPINVAKEILPQLRTKGKVERGWLGVTIQAVTEDLARTYGLTEPRGALVSSVNPASPAEKAGLKAEDVVLAADGRPIEDNGSLSRYIASRAPGSPVRLEVLRAGGERRTLTVTLGTFPEDPTRTADQEEGRTQLGMSLRSLTPEVAERLELPASTRGVVVTAVMPGEAADDAGIVRGDVIVTVNGEAVDDVDAFERAIHAARPNGAARLRVLNPNPERGSRVVVLNLK